MTMVKRAAIMSLLLVATVAGQNAAPYGVDTSFPMHHLNLNEEHLSGRAEFYQNFIDGCKKLNGPKKEERCIWNEEERIGMNLNQPRDMKNYTSAGFAKIQAPTEVTKLLQGFWKDHKGEQVKELWPKDAIYVNHWEVDVYVVHPSEELKDAIVELVRPVIEAWTGQKLIMTSIYGIRVYKEGSILSPHVDRLPLVSSCILNVAQEVDEDWPLEVISHDGKAYNVTAKPGDMILYESHSIIHGRPFPLKGKYYANIFVHFEPHGYTLNHGAKYADKDDLEELQARYDAAAQYAAEMSDETPDEDVPDYVDEDKRIQWQQDYIYKAEQKVVRSTHVEIKKALTPHTAAAIGELRVLKEFEATDPSLLTSADVNGWAPIHEAARSGQFETVKYLVERGANVNERTNQGRGGTPLFWAEQMLSADDETIKYLKGQGAINLPPQSPEEKTAKKPTKTEL